ncbi:hypothetical protein CYMTET_16037 [Cymbomonas tetramitiformis]|nr:hypothetical protein CYMTET_16037 [Cymbomonas tetramitiformis]
MVEEVKHGSTECDNRHLQASLKALLLPLWRLWRRGFHSNVSKVSSSSTIWVHLAASSLEAFDRVLCALVEHGQDMALIQNALEASQKGMKDLSRRCSRAEKDQVAGYEDLSRRCSLAEKDQEEQRVRTNEYSRLYSNISDTVEVLTTTLKHSSHPDRTAQQKTSVPEPSCPGRDQVVQYIPEFRPI